MQAQSLVPVQTGRMVAWKPKENAKMAVYAARVAQGISSLLSLELRLACSLDLAAAN